MPASGPEELHLHWLALLCLHAASELAAREQASASVGEHEHEWQSQRTWDRKMQLIQEETAGKELSACRAPGRGWAQGSIVFWARSIGPNGGWGWASELEGRE